MNDLPTSIHIHIVVQEASHETYIHYANEIQANRNHMFAKQNYDTINPKNDLHNSQSEITTSKQKQAIAELQKKEE